MESATRGGCWGVTVEQYLNNNYGMTPMIDDSALYVNHRDNIIVEVCGLYVDDSLDTGNHEFQTHTEATLKRSNSKAILYNSFDFLGCQIKTFSTSNFKSTSEILHRELIHGNHKREL